MSTPGLALGPGLRRQEENGSLMAPRAEPARSRARCPIRGDPRSDVGSRGRVDGGVGGADPGGALRTQHWPGAQRAPLLRIPDASQGNARTATMSSQTQHSATTHQDLQPRGAALPRQPQHTKISSRAERHHPASHNTPRSPTARSGITPPATTLGRKSSTRAAARAATVRSGREEVRRSLREVSDIRRRAAGRTPAIKTARPQQQTHANTKTPNQQHPPPGHNSRRAPSTEPTTGSARCRAVGADAGHQTNHDGRRGAHSRQRTVLFPSYYGR